MSKIRNSGQAGRSVTNSFFTGPDASAGKTESRTVRVHERESATWTCR